MLQPGVNVEGQVALRKVVHQFLVDRAVQPFRARDIASQLNLSDKQVSAVLAQLSTDQKAALHYPHVVKVAPGVFTFNPAIPQTFTVKKKTSKKPIKATVPNTIQPMADYTVDRDAIVLRHKSGRLFIARPVN